jgi:hypothetical protein
VALSSDDPALDSNSGFRRLAGRTVLKQWHKLEDAARSGGIGQSVGWADLWPQLKNLPVAQGANKTRPIGSKRIWPNRPHGRALRAPMEEITGVSSEPGTAIVFAVNLTGTAESYVFNSGTTYYIETSFSVGAGAATFQPGCVIKYNNDADLLLFGYIQFPTITPTLGPQMPVLTEG